MHGLTGDSLPGILLYNPPTKQLKEINKSRFILFLNKNKQKKTRVKCFQGMKLK